jgi:hypothetical protein
MLLKSGILEVVVVALAWHRPWCGDDTRALSWGFGMHQAMVWAKAAPAHHHGASGITFSSATRVIFSTQKVY